MRKLLAVCALVAVGLLGMAGCIGEPAGEPAPERVPTTTAEAEEVTAAEARTLITSESIGEAPEAATTTGEACRAYCATSYAAVCLRITTLCAGAEVITIGTSSIPCVTAISGVCLSSVALASLCNGRCPP